MCRAQGSLDVPPHAIFPYYFFASGYAPASCIQPPESVCHDEVPQATASSQSTQTDLSDLTQSEAQTEMPTVSVS